MYDNMLQNAVLKIESIKEYFLSQIDQIEESIKKDGKKYFLGEIIDYYLYTKAVDNPNLLEGKTGEKVKRIAENLITELTIESTGDETVSMSFKVNNNEEFEKKGYELNPNKAARELNKIKERSLLFGNSSLMMLLIKYEEVISQLFEFLVTTFPDAYLNKKTVCYSEIIENNSDGISIKEYFVKKEVEEVMRKSVIDWYKLLEQNHKVSFSILNEYFEEFKEIYYRRNIIVHNNGIVNRTYLKGVDEVARKDIKLGEELYTNKSYMERAFNLTYIMIYGTFIETLKLCEDKDKIISLMFELGYQHMIKEEWIVSKFIFYNLQQIRNQQESDIMLDKINYWISIKNCRGLDEIRNEIEKCDVSAMSDKFKMAKAALLDQYEITYILLKKMFPHDMSANSIQEWPLFIQYRKSEEYKKFTKEFSEYFNVYDYKHEAKRPDASNQEVNINDEKSIVDNIEEINENSANDEAACIKECKED